MKPEVHKVDARFMGRAFSSDKDLALPERPRLIPELLCLGLEGGFQFVGGEHEQVIRGKSVHTLLPRLLPLLDGRRTLAEIARAAPGVPAAHVAGAVSLLYSRGLLEEGAAASEARCPDVLAFLGRHIDVSRANPNRETAFARLAVASVLIQGPEVFSAELLRQLSESGVGEVRRDGSRGAKPTLGVVLSTAAGPAPSCELDQRYFFVRFGRDEVHLGPLVVPGITACVSCLARLHPHPPGEPEPELVRYWLGLASMQLVHTLSRLVVAASFGSFQVYRRDADGALTRETRLAPPMPGCADCGLGGLRLEPTDPRLIGWIYHWSTALPSREVVTPKAHQMHYAVSNLNLASEPKPPLFSGDRSGLALPAPDVLTAPPWWLDGASPPTKTDEGSLGDLATLLGRTAGYVVEAGGLRRLAPTGGNLGSVDLWIVAARVPGLPAGVYHYDAPRHRLEFVRRLDAGALAPYGDPACLIVGTGALKTCAQKYGNFAYRLIYLDSGVALAYLHAIARALGLPLRELGDLDDLGVAERLGIPTRWEFPVPTFALTLGGRATTPARPGAAPAPLSPEDYSDRILDRLLAAAVHPMPPVTTPADRPRRRRPRGLPVGLASLDAVLVARRAVRDYTDEPVHEAVLEDILAVSCELLADRVARGAAPVHVRALLAVTRAGGGLAPGLYELGPGSSHVQRRAPFDAQAMLASTNQESLAAAPAAIFMLADLAAAAEQGARGYRIAVQHAGAAIGQAWLAATAAGLGGTAAGGVIVGGLRQAAGLDPYRECPLLAFHFGHPRSTATVGA